MTVRYWRQSATEYTVWANQKIGVVQKFGMRWLAISPAHRSLGSFASMSEAGEALRKEAATK